MKRFGNLIIVGMSALLVLSLLSALTPHRPQTKPQKETLRENRWKKRVLLVAAPNARQADFQHQLSLLATQEAGLAARDFLVLPVLYEQLSAADQQFLQREMGVQPPAFAVMLIGKDGGVKEKNSRPIKPENLFGTVDQMPMRRQEMRRQ
jgi:hypothetical protein